MTRGLSPAATYQTYPAEKKRRNFTEEQHFRRAAVSADFLSSLSQQLFSAAFLSSSSQQPFSAALLSSSSQQLFSPAFLSSSFDLDKLAQHKALQDGHALEKREAIQSLAKQIGDQLQRWSPSTQADTSSQHKIAELEARLAALQAAANQPPAAASQQAQVPAQAPEAPSPSPRVPSPIEAALQGQRPTVFDPAQLLVSPGSNNQWLENNMIDTLSDSKYKSWFKNLKLDNATRQTIERNIVAVDNWWQNQPEEAEATIHRVAVCSGIPPAKIKSG